jgi:hypothetical protein
MIVASGPAEVYAALVSLDSPEEAPVRDQLMKAFTAAADQYRITTARDAFCFLSLHSPFYNPAPPDDREALARRVTTELNFDDPIRTGHLISELKEISPELTAEVAERAAACMPISSPRRLEAFVQRLVDIGLDDQADVLLQRAMDHALDQELFLQWADTAGRELRRHLYSYGREPDGEPASRWSWPFDALSVSLV